MPGIEIGRAYWRPSNTSAVGLVYAPAVRVAATARSVAAAAPLRRGLFRSAMAMASLRVSTWGTPGAGSGALGSEGEEAVRFPIGEAGGNTCPKTAGAPARAMRPHCNSKTKKPNLHNA